jgi:hypothetical protein
MRFWRQFGRDILWLEARIEQTKGVMRLVTFLVIAFLATAGVSAVLAREWWLTPISSLRSTPAFLGLSALALFFVFYCGVVFVRSRKPMLAVGGLRPDVRGDDSFFQMRVENLGPGTVQPIASFAYLRDGQGHPLPHRTTYLGQEIHWRYFSEANKRPYLAEGKEAYAGVFWIRAYETEAPEIWIYPLSLQTESLWQGAVPLPKQTGLRLKIAITYKQKELNDKEALMVKRSYILIPDKTQPLKYKAKRVWFRSLFWR